MTPADRATTGVADGTGARDTGGFASRVRSLAWRQRDAIRFAGANLLVQAVAMVCQFWVLRFVPPEQMGVWAFVSLVQGYALVTQFGIINAMNREYPFFVGAGDRERAEGVVRTAQAYALCNGVLLGLGFLVAALVFAGRGTEWTFALLAGAATLPLVQYTSYLEGTYRSGNDFRTLSNIRLAVAAATVVALALPWRFGFAGYCAQVVLVAAVPAVLGHLFRPVRLTPRFEPGFLRLLYATGWRLHLWNYLSRAAQSFPRLALATLGGTLHLGLFVPVNAAYLGVNNLTGSLSAYLYPNLTRRYAQGTTSVGSVALRASLLAMAGLAGPVILGIVAVPLIVPVFLPSYAAAVVPAQVALVAGLLECMSIATVAFAASKAWMPMSVHLACGLVIRLAAALCGAMLFDDRLLGVACGMLGASALMALVTWATVSAVARRPGASTATVTADEPDGVPPEGATASEVGGRVERLGPDGSSP